MNHDKALLQRALTHPMNVERRDYPFRRSTKLVSMQDMRWLPPHTLDISHCHNCLEIGMCMEGHGTIAIGGVFRPFGPGTIVMVPSGLPHAQLNEEEVPVHWRYAGADEYRLLEEGPPSVRQAVREMLEKAQKSGFYCNEGSFAEEMGKIFSKMFELKETLGEQAIPEMEALLMLLLTRAAREVSWWEGIPTEETLCTTSVDPALEYVSDHYGQEIRIKELARLCSMSESYFRKIFEETIGTPPLEYVNRYRIHHAMHLLRVGGRTMQSIAMDCGFMSVATFNRNFLRYVGKTPTEWVRHSEQIG